VPVWEAVDLCEQLLLDIGSHLSASMAGWKYPMSRGDLNLMGLLTRVMSATRGKDEKPFMPDWPWPDEPKAEDVTPAERIALKKQLRARSAFGQKRTET